MYVVVVDDDDGEEEMKQSKKTNLHIELAYLKCFKRERENLRKKLRVVSVSLGTKALFYLDHLFFV